MAHSSGCSRADGSIDVQYCRVLHVQCLSTAGVCQLQELLQSHTLIAVCLSEVAAAAPIRMLLCCPVIVAWMQGCSECIHVTNESSHCSLLISDHREPLQTPQTSQG